MCNQIDNSDKECKMRYELYLKMHGKSDKNITLENVKQYERK